MLVLTFPADVVDRASLQPNIGARALSSAGGGRRTGRRSATLGRIGGDLLFRRVPVGGRGGLGEVPWRVRETGQNGLRIEFEKISARWRNRIRQAVERRVDSLGRYACARGAEVSAGKLGEGGERRGFKPGFRGG